MKGFGVSEFLKNTLYELSFIAKLCVFFGIIIGIMGIINSSVPMISFAVFLIFLAVSNYYFHEDNIGVGNKEEPLPWHKRIQFRYYVFSLVFFVLTIGCLYCWYKTPEVNPKIISFIEPLKKLIREFSNK